MTLRNPNKEEETKEEEKEQMRNELKLKAFSDMLKETAKYLILNYSDYHDNPTDRRWGVSKSIIAEYKFYIGLPIAIVGWNNSKNIYVSEFFKTLIFGPNEKEFNNSVKKAMYHFGSNGATDNYHYWPSYLHNGKEYSFSEYLEYCECEYQGEKNEYLQRENKNLISIIEDYNTMYSINYGIVYERYSTAHKYNFYLSCDSLKLNVIFWNLFLCALDDDIYNEQLPLVIELAHCFKLDEHIVADICRAVEYVLSGKKLSEDCDLYCETVECAKFFLGHE